MSVFEYEDIEVSYHSDIGELPMVAIEIVVVEI